MSRVATLLTVAVSGFATLGVKVAALQFTIPEADIARWIFFGVGAWIGLNVWHTGKAVATMEGVFAEHAKADLRTFASYDQAFVTLEADVKGLTAEVTRAARHTVAQVHEIVSRQEVRIERLEERSQQKPT